MSTLTPFQKKAMEHTRHIALTANAGSGKTFVLAKRFVEIVLEKNLPLSKIVAITFTEKAAGELYKRIAEEINDRLKEEKDKKKISILRRIRRQLVSANISTIHSFCADLIKEFAPDIGVDTSFRPVDERISGELLDVTIGNFVASELQESFSNKTAELVRLFDSAQNLIKELKKLFAKRKTVERMLSEIKEKSSGKGADNLRKFFETKFEDYFGNFFEEILVEIKAVNDAVLNAEGENVIAQSVDELLPGVEKEKDVVKKILLLKNITTAITVNNGEKIRSQKYCKRSIRKTLDARLPSSLEAKLEILTKLKFDENPEEAEALLFEYRQKLLDLFEKILTEYERRKKALGYLDFEDLLLGAAKILKKEEARKLLSERFEFIMVDEYQDTNETQYEIIMPLLNQLKKGNLFVVGDDKQSIYMFREAELKIFEKTKEEIETSSDSESVLELPHSFRLAPNIAFFTNKIFKNIFANPNKKFNEVAHSDLICARKKNAGGKVEIFVTPEKEMEAEFVARKILLLRKEKIKYKEIAVLCRKRNLFDELSDAFLKYGIPFSILGSKGFYQSQIVSDVFNFLSFLLDNSNDAALIAVLRSPFFYFTDKLLLEMNFQRGKNFFEKLNQFARVNPNVLEAVSFLNKYTLLASELPLNELLRKSIAESGYLSVISSRENSELQKANLEKLISIANDFGNESFNTFYDFVEFLNNAINGIEDESEAEVIAEEDKVQIMTIHQSKGLEFSAVFIYGSHVQPNHPDVKEKSVVIDNEYGILMKVPARNNFFESYKEAPIVGLYKYYIERKESAENKRLFYVAVTRAKDYLCLSGSYNNNSSFRKDSFLKMTFDALGKDKDENSIELEGELEFMTFEKEDSKIDKDKIKFEIPVFHDLPEVVTSSQDGSQPTIPNRNLSEPFYDFPKDEIFSATRISAFEQCPLKYKLIYELGYAKLEKLLDENTNFDFKSEDEEDVIPANVKGSIIHKILEKEIPSEQLRNFIKDYLTAEDFPFDENSNSVGEIFDVVEAFRNSKVFLDLTKYNNYKNELPIYLRENDYFLFGILDKLIFAKDKIIIVDYKTDAVKKGEGEKKFKNYENQLLFYSYLIKKYFNPNLPVEVRLLFVRNPEESVVQILDNSKIEQFGQRLAEIISKIKERKFEKNTDHCFECQFFVSSNCKVE